MLRLPIKVLHKSIADVFIFSIFIFSVFTSCQSSDIDPVSGQNNNNSNTSDNSGDTSGDDTGNMDEDVGGIAPAFTLLSTYGDSVSLADYKGNVIVLFFLGNACPSCKSVAPSVERDLNGAYDTYSQYTILGLDQWDGNKDELNAFRETTHVTFPLLLMASGVASEYGTTYDRLVVVDQEGKIAFKGRSTTYNDLDDVKDLINTLLSN